MTTTTTPPAPALNVNNGLDFLNAVLLKDALTLRNRFGVSQTDIDSIDLERQQQVSCKLLAANNAVLAASARRPPAEAKPAPVTPAKAVFSATVPKLSAVS